MRTCIEVCPHLNGDLTRHPARRMIEEGLAVTFCTANALVWHMDMVRELSLSVELGPTEECCVQWVQAFVHSHEIPRNEITTDG